MKLHKLMMTQSMCPLSIKKLVKFGWLKMNTVNLEFTTT